MQSCCEKTKYITFHRAHCLQNKAAVKQQGHVTARNGSNSSWMHGGKQVMTYQVTSMADHVDIVSS
jgi:hypothetical protein